MKKVIVSSPLVEYHKYENHSSHNMLVRPYAEKAVSQHDTLKQLLVGSGCEVIDIPELPGHPNSVFTRDTAVCSRSGYIHLRMGLASRKGEEDWMAEVLDKQGIECRGKIEPPATVEGGDVILAGRVAFVGNSRRTNLEGIVMVKNILEPLGYEVRCTMVPQPFLHIGGAMSFIYPDRILCCDKIFAYDFFSGFETIRIPMNGFISGNVICAGGNSVIVERSNIPAIRALHRSGCEILEVDLSEFIKGNGGPSCLIMPVC